MAGWGRENEPDGNTNYLLLKTHYVPGILSGMQRLLAHHILLTPPKSGYYYYLFISMRKRPPSSQATCQSG